MSSGRTNPNIFGFGIFEGSAVRYSVLGLGQGSEGSKFGFTEVCPMVGQIFAELCMLDVRAFGMFGRSMFDFGR